jgi:hypothetical protein
VVSSKIRLIHTLKTVANIEIYDLTTSGDTATLSFVISINFRNTIHSAYEPESMDCVKTFGLLHLLLCLEGGRVKARVYNQICM